MTPSRRLRAATYPRLPNGLRARVGRGPQLRLVLTDLRLGILSRTVEQGGVQVAASAVAGRRRCAGLVKV